MGTRLIVAGCFPTPDVVKVTNDAADWEKLGRFAEVQAEEAREALALLDERLTGATMVAERVAAFEAAYQHVARWRYRIAEQGSGSRPGAIPEDFRTPIGKRSGYWIKRTAIDREPVTPSERLLARLQRVAVDRLNGAEELQNVVRLRDGRLVDGNRIVTEPAKLNAMARREHPEATPFYLRTHTAVKADRDALRRAAFETLADLETQRAATGLDPQDPELRQAFADAAYFLVQGPEFNRGSDAVMRTFLVAAHTRVFDAAPVLPQAIDLDGMVRGQDGFSQVMREQYRLLPEASSRAAESAPARGIAVRRQSGIER